MTTHDSSAGSVHLLVKNPTDQPGTTPFSFTVPLSLTVGLLKHEIAERYPCHPSPDRQRLIFSGKLLSDDVTLSSVLAGFDTSAPQTFHIVISCAPPSSLGDSGPVSGRAQDPLENVQHERRRTTATPPPQAYSANTQAPPPRTPALTAYGAYPFPVFPGAGAPTGGGYPPAIHPYHPHLYYRGPIMRPVAGDGAQPPSSHGVPYVEPVDFPVGDGQHHFYAPYGNFGVFDPAYFAHIEAVQQRLVQEYAVNQHGLPYPQQQNPPQFNMQPAVEINQTHGGNGAVGAGMGHAQVGVAGNNVEPIAAGAVDNNVPFVRQYVFRFELNWSLISKLILVVILLGQEGSSQRLYVLGGTAVLVYLWQTGRLSLMRRIISVVLPDPVHLFAIVLPTTESSEAQRINWTAMVMSYIYAFVYGFVCSLLPTWQPMELPRVQDVLASYRAVHEFDAQASNSENEGAGHGSSEDQAAAAPNVNHEHAD